MVVGLAAGMNVSGCLTEDGTAYLWGSNVNYQLAKGDEDEVGLCGVVCERAGGFLNQ